MSEDLEMVVVNEGVDLGKDEQQENTEIKMKEEDGKEDEIQTKHILPHWVEVWSKIVIYICIAACVFFFIAFIVAYAVFIKAFHQRVNSIENVTIPLLFSLN